MADNPNIRDTQLNKTTNAVIEQLSKDIQDLSKNIESSKKGTVLRGTSKSLTGIGGRAILNGLAIRSPLLYMAKGVFEEVQGAMKERRANERKLASKQKKLEEEVQKEIGRQKKKAEREEAAAKKAEEKAVKAAERKAAKEAKIAEKEEKASAKLIKSEESSNSTASKVSKDDEIFFKRYPELAGILDNDEEQKQTAALNELVKNQKQTAKRTRLTDREREQKQKRSEFMKTKAAAQPRGADGRFMKATKTESLLEKLLKVMMISNALKAVSGLGGGMMKGALGGIFGAISAIFNPKNLLALVSPKKIFGTLFGSIGKILKFVGRLSGLFLRVAGIGGIIVAGIVGLLSGIDAFINTEGTIGEKLIAGIKGFFMGIAHFVIGSFQAIFGEEAVMEWVNKFGQVVDNMFAGIMDVWEGIKMLFTDPDKRKEALGLIWDGTKKAFMSIAGFLVDALKSIGNYLAAIEFTIPYTNKKVKPFKFLATNTDTRTSTPPTPTATPAKTNPEELPAEALMSTAPSRVSYESTDALLRAKQFNETSKMVAQGVPSTVGNSTPIIPVVTNVSNNLNQGTVVGIQSNIRDQDATITRMLQ